MRARAHGDEQVQQMELEVRSLDAATRRELSKKVDQYKKSLVSLKADHSAIREKEEREGLFGDRDDLAVRFLWCWRAARSCGGSCGLMTYTVCALAATRRQKNSQDQRNRMKAATDKCVARVASSSTLDLLMSSRPGFFLL